MLKKYWCLFCGEGGPKFEDVEKLFDHMKTTVHRTSEGGMVFFNGDKNIQ